MTFIPRYFVPPEQGREPLPPSAALERPQVDISPAVTAPGAPLPPVVTEPHRPGARPDHATLAAQRGHCGTCKHFTLTPEDRYMGVCALGWAAHEPYRSASQNPVTMNAAARCMTVDRHAQPSPRWALRAGVLQGEVLG